MKDELVSGEGVVMCQRHERTRRRDRKVSDKFNGQCRETQMPSPCVYHFFRQWKASEALEQEND